MKPLLQPKLGQHLNLSQQLRQAIELLLLPTMELQQQIQRMVENNSLLEVEFENEISETPEIEFSTIDNFDHNRPITSNNFDFKTSSTTLKTYLFWQLELSSFTEKDKAIATLIIDAINEDGYLENSLTDIYIYLKNDPEFKDIKLNKIEIILDQIQQFDPIGVGARNLSECLNIQVNHLPKETPWKKEIKALVTYHLDSLKKGKFTYLQNKLNLNAHDLKSAITILSSLHPKPGRKQEFQETEYNIPDVLIRKKNKLWVVELYMDYIPKLKINAHYSTLIKRAGSSQNEQFLIKQLKEAQWFLRCLEKRHEILLKVATCIIEQQFGFFESGPMYLKPLNLKAIADTVGLHSSTVSRILSHKYVDTPKGLFELNYFLGTSIETITGEQYSSKAVQAIIKRLITEENNLQPFSDHQIAQLLLEQGIKITRRTVTKYREIMVIPSSYERKWPL